MTNLRNIQTIQRKYPWYPISDPVGVGQYQKGKFESGLLIETDTREIEVPTEITDHIARKNGWHPGTLYEARADVDYWRTVELIAESVNQAAEELA
jgi:hypothetical protein